MLPDQAKILQHRLSRSESHLDWSSTPVSTSEDFFDLLQRVQASRIDDQRCSLPANIVNNNKIIPESQSRLEKILREEEPYPMISLPPTGVWWSEKENSFASDDHETGDDDVSRVFRAQFLQTEHFNFVGLVTSETGGDLEQPLVVSIKYYSDDHVRLIVRLPSGSHHHFIDVSQIDEVNEEKILLKAPNTILYFLFRRCVLCSWSVSCIHC